LLASWGAGIVVGSLVYLVVRQRSPLVVIALSTAAIGAAYLGMATAQSLLVACLVSVVGGAGNGIQWISVVTAVQEATPNDYQARIVGFLESIGAAMPGLGYVLGGALVAIGSPRTAYAVAGAGVLVLVVAAVALRPRLERPAPAPPFVADTHAGEVPLSDSLAAGRRFETSGRDLR
jgi:MFS family permease